MNLRGVTTRAVPKKEVRLYENGTGNGITVGRYDDTLPGTENKMRPCTEAFASFGTALLERLASCADEWVCVDEIGYLETEFFTQFFCRKIFFRAHFIFPFESLYTTGKTGKFKFFLRKS